MEQHPKCVFCGLTSDSTGLNASVCSMCREKIFPDGPAGRVESWRVVCLLAERVTRLEAEMRLRLPDSPA